MANKSYVQSKYIEKVRWRGEDGCVHRYALRNGFLDAVESAMRDQPSRHLCQSGDCALIEGERAFTGCARIACYGAQDRNSLRPEVVIFYIMILGTVLAYLDL